MPSGRTTVAGARTKGDDMAIGPVEYMVVAFPGNKFRGDILPELNALVDAGTIRILDFAFAGKDADGSVAGYEIEDLDSSVMQAFEAIEADRGGLISHEDVLQVADSLEQNNSAAILVWEDVWATKLTEALRGAGAELVEIARIPHDVVTDAIEWAEENYAAPVPA